MATVKGVWVFEEKVNVDFSYANRIVQDVNFSYENYAGVVSNCIQIIIGQTSSTNDKGIRTLRDDGTYHFLTRGVGTWSQVYISDARTIDFGTTEQTVSDIFYAWFTANATQQASEEDAGGATVAYNGSDLLSLEAGQTGTLNCAGTKMAGDVVVSFEGAGSVAYNGSVIASLSAGQTATLYCAGKKMAGNIVITCDGGSN